MKRYASTILLLLPLLLLPVNWYGNLVSDPQTYQPLGTSGLDTMLDSGLRVGLLFLFVVVIHLLSVKGNTMIVSILSRIIFCLVLIFYPIQSMEAFTLYIKMMLDFYSIGFYLSVLLIMLSILADVKDYKKFR